jgi:hypothetical protein
MVFPLYPRIPPPKTLARAVGLCGVVGHKKCFSNTEKQQTQAQSHRSAPPWPRRTIRHVQGRRGIRGEVHGRHLTGCAQGARRARGHAGHTSWAAALELRQSDGGLARAGSSSKISATSPSSVARADAGSGSSPVTFSAFSEGANAGAGSTLVTSARLATGASAGAGSIRVSCLNEFAAVLQPASQRVAMRTDTQFDRRICRSSKSLKVVLEQKERTFHENVPRERTTRTYHENVAIGIAITTRTSQRQTKTTTGSPPSFPFSEFPALRLRNAQPESLRTNSVQRSEKKCAIGAVVSRQVCRFRSPRNSHRCHETPRSEALNTSNFSNPRMLRFGSLFAKFVPLRARPTIEPLTGEVS